MWYNRFVDLYRSQNKPGGTKMKKFIRILALLMTAVILMGSLCVTASAADSKVSLLSMDLKKIDKLAENVTYLGQDLYLFWSETERSIYRIDSAAIENWRKTGKLKAEKTKINSDMTDHVWNIISNRIEDYIICYYTDDKGADHSYILKYSKKKNAFDQVYTSENNIGITPDGYISYIRYDESKEKLTVKILSPKGKQIKKLTYSLKGKIAWWNPFWNSCPYVAVSIYDDNEKELKNGKLVLIDKKGKTKTLKNTYAASMITYEDGIIYKKKTVAEYDPVAYSDIYLFADKKNYTFEDRAVLVLKGEEGSETDRYFYIDDVSTGTIGDYILARYHDTAEGSDEAMFILVDYKNNKLGKYDYDFMNSYDNGKTFVFCIGNKWSYTDTDENIPDVSTAFDDAAAFCGNGEYAPVIKNGKIFLIDRSLKRASGTIKAKNSNVYTLGEELFCYRKSGKVYLLTYKK